MPTWVVNMKGRILTGCKVTEEIDCCCKTQTAVMVSARYLLQLLLTSFSYDGYLFFYVDAAFCMQLRKGTTLYFFNWTTLKLTIWLHASTWTIPFDTGPKPSMWGMASMPRIILDLQHQSQLPVLPTCLNLDSCLEHSSIWKACSKMSMRIHHVT